LHESCNKQDQNELEMLEAIFGYRNQL